MNYLQKQRDGDYKFFSGETGTVLEIEVRYDLGGQSMFGMGHRNRGIRLRLTPCERSGYSTTYKIDFGAGGAKSGGSIILRELKRKSQKITDLIAADVDQRVGEIVGLWEAGNYQAALDICRELRSKWYVQESAATGVAA